MKLKENAPALLLDFRPLSNSARIALSAMVQGFLVSLGFHWESDRQHTGKPLHLTADALIINSGDGCPVSLRMIREGQLDDKPQADTTYFDVTQELDEFLDALQETLPLKPEDQLDLLARTFAELAKRKQAADNIFQRA